MKKHSALNIAINLFKHGFMLAILAVTGFLLLAEESPGIECLLYIAPCFTDTVWFFAEEKNEYHHRGITAVSAVALVASVIGLILSLISLGGYPGVNIPMFICMGFYPLRESILVAFYLVLAIRS